jgi:hypothetical protein
MKVVVSLAILVAALLLVSNMAFAQCDQLLCYDIVTTDEHGNTIPDLWIGCFYNNGVGLGHSVNENYDVDLYLFGGGPGWFNTSGDPAIGGNPRYTTWIIQSEDVSGYLQPIGDGYMLTGEGVQNGTRYTIKGVSVPCQMGSLP